MKELSTAASYLILSVLTLLALVNCTSIKIQNGEVCAVAGVLQAGADCADTLTPNTRSMTFEELVVYLEPQTEVKDSKGKVTTPARGGALIVTADYFNHLKTRLEQACAMLKNACTYDIQQQIATLNSQVTGLATRTMAKKVAKKK